MPQTLMYKVLVYLGVAVVALVAGCFLGYTYDHRAFDTYKAQVALAAQKGETASVKVEAKDDVATQKVDDEAKQIGDMSTVIGDLRVRLAAAERRRALPAPTASSPAAHAEPDGRAAAAGAGAICAAPEALDPALTRDTVQLEIAHIKSLQLWREYARSTGQVR
jgi:hypothetical protein